MLNRYILSLTDYNQDSKSFIIRQVKRMPSHYYFGLAIICSLFYFMKIKPSQFQLLNKLISSLGIIKSYEK